MPNVKIRAGRDGELAPEQSNSFSSGLPFFLYASISFVSGDFARRPRPQCTSTSSRADANMKGAEASEASADYIEHIFGIQI